MCSGPARQAQHLINLQQANFEADPLIWLKNDVMHNQMALGREKSIHPCPRARLVVVKKNKKFSSQGLTIMPKGNLYPADDRFPYHEITVGMSKKYFSIQRELTRTASSLLGINLGLPKPRYLLVPPTLFRKFLTASPFHSFWFPPSSSGCYLFISSVVYYVISGISFSYKFSPHFLLYFLCIS